MKTMAIYKYHLVAVGLTLAIFCIFAGSLSFAFADLDDGVYVYANRTLKTESLGNQIKWAFTTFENGMWHPVTWLTFIVEHKLWGQRAFGYRLTNIWLHVITTILLWRCLQLLRIAPLLASLVTIVFALHPARIESVVWISERKGLLGGAFLLTTFLLYVEYLHGRSRKVLFWSYLTFLFALLSKPFMVLFPCFLFALDAFFRDGSQSNPHGAANRRTLLLVKLPYFALAIVVGFVGFFSQASVGAVAEASLEFRIANCFASCLHYVRVLFWPTGIVMLYARPGWWAPGVILASIICVVIMSWLALGMRVKQPLVFLGWCWFVFGILPTSGLIPNGPHCYAERYSYIPAVGLLLMTLGLLRHFGAQLKAQQYIYLVWGLVCAGLTTYNLPFWRNPEMQWTRTLALRPGNAPAHNNLGAYLLQQGRIATARSHFVEAVFLWPEDDVARMNLIYVEVASENFKRVRAEFLTGMFFRPKDGMMRSNYETFVRLHGTPQQRRGYLESWYASEPFNSKANEGLARLLFGDNVALARSLDLAERACRLSHFAEPAALALLGDIVQATANWHGSCVYYNMALACKTLSPELKLHCEFALARTTNQCDMSNH